VGSYRQFGVTVMQILAAPFYGVSGDYQSIATVTVGSGGATVVTFSGIPQTYKHLQLRYIARSSTGGEYNPNFQINSDTAGNYRWHYVTGNGTTASAGDSGASPTSIVLGIVPSATSNFGVSIIDFLDYADTTKFKTTRNVGGRDTNGAGEALVISGLWRSTAAISTITLNFSGAAQYSHFALYGIKG